MKISVDHVTNSSSESFGTVIIDTAVAIGLSIPYIAATLGQIGKKEENDDSIPEDDWGYEPYESTDPNDLPGTILQNNRDGTTTKTLPDGTIGTKMKDGTIYVTQPDGTTGIIEPDGHQKMTLPDGTKVEHYSDGTSYAEYPDGTSRTEYEDGTVREQDPSGEIVQVNPDGSFEVTEVGKSYTKIYTSEGSIAGAKDSNGTNITIDENGNIKGKYVSSDGHVMDVEGNDETGFSGKDSEGNFFELDKDGEIKKLFVKNGDDFLKIDEDGSMKAKATDKETGDTFELDYNPETGTKYKDSKGNFIDVDKDGKGRAKLKNDECEFELREDGSSTYKDDQIEMTTDKDGRVEARDSEGNYEIVQPKEDGSLEFESGNADGPKATGKLDKDGNYELNAKDGSQMIIKDSKLTIRDKDGTTNTYTKEDIDKMVAEHQAQKTTSEEGGDN